MINQDQTSVKPTMSDAKKCPDCGGDGLLHVGEYIYDDVCPACQGTCLAEGDEIDDR